MSHELTTNSPEQTRALGRCLGQQIDRALVIRLCGDLGSGKTCFVQGLAEGLQVPQAYGVTSPTYTLINEYPGRKHLFHIDLYRLAGVADVENIGFWEILGSDAVIAVEWAERIADELWPAQNIKIELRLERDESHHLYLKGYGLEMEDLVRRALDLWENNALAR